MTDNSKRFDFSAARYGTDNGPACTCNPGHPGLWIYLHEGITWYDERSWRVVGQCACCHRVVEFPVPMVGFPGGDITIGDIKTAHTGRERLLETWREQQEGFPGAESAVRVVCENTLEC